MKASISTTRYCTVCQKVFKPTSNSQVRCEICQKEVVRLRKDTKPCVVCGTLFDTFNKKTRKYRITCNPSCRNSLVGRNPRTFTYPEKQCEQCKKVYKPISDHQKFCSHTCGSKNQYEKHNDRIKAYEKIRITKQRLGLNIRDEHLGQPTRIAKWLWDGKGKWCPKNPDIEVCVECNTNVYRHNGIGVCMYCYDKLRTRDEEAQKEAQRRSYQNQKERGKIFSRSEAKTWTKRAQNKEIPITPKIENILKNLEEL